MEWHLFHAYACTFPYILDTTVYENLILFFSLFVLSPSLLFGLGVLMLIKIEFTSFLFDGLLPFLRALADDLGMTLSKDS